MATLLDKLSFVAVVPADAPDTIVQPVGTGPYRMKSAGSDGTLALSAFPEYWGPAPAEARVEILPIAAPERRFAALRDGGVDLVEALPPHDIARARQTPGMRPVTAPGLSVEVLELRTDRGPLADPRVREAIDRALDRSVLVDELLDGEGEPIDQLVPAHVVGHVPDLVPPPRDLPRARMLLRQAGYPHGLDLELELHEGRDVGPLLRQLAEAGIRVHPRPLPWDRLYARLVAGEVDFHYGGMVADSGDASDVFDEMVHSRDPQGGYGASNAIGFTDAAIDHLIERSATTLKPLERRELLQECMRHIVESRAFIPLFVPHELYATRDGIDWTPRLDGVVLAVDVHRSTKR